MEPTFHDIDRVTCELLGVLTDSAWENLEYSKGTTGDQASRKHTIPGWNDRVKPFQNDAKFWNSLWISAGKPKHSEVPGVEHNLFTYMKFSKNQYHYNVRRTQNSLNLIENDKLISNMNSPNLFEEIKKACKETNSNVTSVIDDIHGAKNITEHFKTIYENLYNEQEDIDEIVTRLPILVKPRKLFLFSLTLLKVLLISSNLINLMRLAISPLIA